MDFVYGEAVTRQRGVPVQGPYSDEDTDLDWTDPDELEIPGCGFNPGTSQEPIQDARNAVITRPEVYAPADADVLAGDRLVVRGDTYEIAGRPQRWISPFTGWAPGLVIQLDLVEG